MVSSLYAVMAMVGFVVLALLSIYAISLRKNLLSQLAQYQQKMV